MSKEEAPGASKPAAPDWERIEKLYRAGVLSVREIAGATSGVSHVAIHKRAKREGWERNLGAKIKAKADALVNKREVNTPVNTESGTSVLTTEREIVDANAEVIAGVRLTQRSDIRRARTLAMSLLHELEAQTVDRELFDRLEELINGAEDGDETQVSSKMLDAFRAVLSLPARTKTMKDLAETLQKLIGLEREAYNIADGARPDAPIPPPGGLGSDANEASKVYMDTIGR